jgi:hypothetical protein
MYLREIRADAHVVKFTLSLHMYYENFIAS